MESLLLTVGRTINLNCSIDGSPSPQLTWILLNGSPLQSGAQFNKFLHKSDGTLVISNPALSEVGTYRCLGRNAAGMVERTVTLMPGHKPEINNRYNSPVSIMNGQSLHLHCLSNTDSVRLAWTLPSGMVLTDLKEQVVMLFFPMEPSQSNKPLSMTEAHTPAGPQMNMEAPY